MRIARKVCMSIFTTMFILITCIATTFAWVGMVSTSTLGSFDLNIKSNKIEADYFLTISSTGQSNSFSDSLNSYDVKRQILANMGYDTSLILDEGIDLYFANNAIMEPVTTDANLTNFYSIYNLKKKKPYLKPHNGYFKFDFYLSVDTLKGISGMSSTELNNLNINANIFFENIEEALSGMYGTDSLINENPFNAIPSNSDYACLKSIDSKKLTVDTKNATRIAFQTYSPIAIDSSYNGNEVPTKTIIYQGGKQLPSVKNNVYDLGGILPEEYNLAIKEINTIYGTNIELDNLYVDTNGDGIITPDEENYYLGAYNRYVNLTDLEMSKDAFCVTRDSVDSSNFSSYYVLDNGQYVTPTSFDPLKTYYNPNNKIWQSPAVISGTNYLGVKNGVRTKMKISMYFWYEGYDADCLRLIDFKPTNLNVLLSTDKVITNS